MNNKASEKINHKKEEKQKTENPEELQELSWEQLGAVTGGGRLDDSLNWRINYAKTLVSEVVVNAEDLF